MDDDGSTSGDLCNQMKNFMLHELMYYKPYEGKMKNRRSEKIEKKCFTDECEWRYIPDLSNTEFQQIYYDPNIMNAGIMNDISNSLTNIKSNVNHLREIRSCFSYCDRTSYHEEQKVWEQICQV